MPDTHTIYQAPRRAPKPGETVVTSTCGHNCGGRCVVNAHVVDDRIVHISTDPARWRPELPPLHACARGVGQIERLYHPDRLQYPMRRVGPRGSGRFERISWDEALDTVAREMLRVRETYGNAALLDASRSGNLSMLHNSAASTKRFFSAFGGSTVLWSNMSAEAEIFAVRTVYGADNKSAGREPTDYVNSKLILMWGWSPMDGTFGTGTPQYLREAKKAGVRIVCVDPRRTRTSAALADEHIYIRPSTDAAALIAMAYVIVSEGLHDQAYCDRYVLGFDDAHLPPGAPAGASYRAYLMGEGGDGIVKTPEWAAAITGIDAATIRRLAIEFATAKPAAVQCGYAPGRTAFGEQFHRAAYALAAITGNVGIVGGSSGCSNGATGRAGIKSLPPGTNAANARVSTPLLADLLARGKAGGYPADIKLIYSVGGDLFNQCPNANKMAASLDGVEFIVAQDHFLTPTARHADIVLPATTFWERNDVHTPWGGAGHYAIFMRQAIAPMYECRNDMDIFADLSRRLGLPAYSDKSEMEWLRDLTKDAVDDFEQFAEKGVARFAPPQDAVAFARQIRDPDNHRFGTPSGKIEVYSTTLAANPDPYALGAMAAIPTWVEPVTPDPRHPLMLCSPKSRARTHSIHGNQEQLGKVDPDDVWIHADDAKARGIANGQTVRVFNDRGATLLPAKVTRNIARGVVSIKEGAWFTPNGNGVDTKGCANVLAEDRAAPCGATTYNTNLVEVEPA